MKNSTFRILILMLVASLCIASFAGCKSSDAGTTEAPAASGEAPTEPTKEPENTEIRINGNPVTFAAEGNTDLNLLSIEKGLTVEVVKGPAEEIKINGNAVEGAIAINDVKIVRDAVIDIEITDEGVTTAHKVNLMPSTFPDYTTEGESTTKGDFYLSTYDLATNYLFKLNNKGELIFYRTITKTDANGNQVNTNGLDFRKQYNSKGEVRYTYMPYLADAFADGDCTGINPGSVVVMDENYRVIDELFYTDKNGEDMLIDPHGFIYLDDGHYILTAYQKTVYPTPEDFGAQKNTANLADLLIQEVKDGKVLWEFVSSDYEKFLYESNTLNKEKSAEKFFDYVHFNSMSLDTDGNLLVSCRHLDAILKISRTDGSLMWQLGGDYDEFGLTDDQLFSYQHSIILTEDGGYMIFDNADTAVDSGKAQFSSVVRIYVDEESKTVTDFVRYNVVDFYSIYMGAIREIDAESSTYLWSVGGHYLTDTKNPPAWSMVEYKENEDGTIEHLFNFKYNEGHGRLYCSNKCE